MKTQNIIKYFFRLVTASLFGYVMLSADTVYAGTGPTAEYKCTKDCSLCINFVGKKSVCSEKYADESQEYQKGRKLSKLVNDGLIIPTADLRPGFSLDGFSKRFFNCELMVKKAEQIEEATQNMCVRKTAKFKNTVTISRSPATSSPVSNKTSAKKVVVIKKKAGEEDASEEMGELIQKIEDEE